VPAEVVKDYMQAILDERIDLALPPAEHDACRIAAWNWGTGFAIEPEFIVGVETMLEVEVGDWTLRGKIDLAQIVAGTAVVHDWKTSLGYPSQETFDNDFQMLFYALLMLEGHPEDADTPLGRGLDGVHVKGHWPRIKSDEGGYFTRSAYKDRAQVYDFKRSIESGLVKLEYGLAMGEWKASPGSHCSYCPAPRECPIPAIELPVIVATEGQASEAGGRLIRLEDEVKALRAGMKGYVEENGEVVIGDQVYRLVAVETESARSKDEIKDALAAGGLDPEEFYRKSRSMRFKREKVK
jgi:hypothetical protein